MSELKELCDFQCGIANVKTMADGSPRITLDCPESVIEYLSLLAKCQQEGRYLHIVIYDEDEFNRAIMKHKGQ